MLSWSRLGGRAGIACDQAEIFPSLSIQETLVRLGVGTGTGLGMEILADFHGMPWAWSKVSI